MAGLTGGVTDPGFGALSEDDLQKRAHLLVYESMYSAAIQAFNEDRAQIVSEVMGRGGVSEPQAVAQIEASLRSNPWAFVFYIESRRFLLGRGL